MSAALAWLAVGVPLAGAAAAWWARRAAGRVAVAVAGVTLVLVLAGAGGDPLATGLAGLAAGAGLLAARPGMAAGAAVRLLAVLGGLELAALAPVPGLASVGLAWVGLAGAVLVMAAGSWPALRVVLPALGLVLAGSLVGAGLGQALLLAGVAGCAGLAPLHGWRRRARGGAMGPALTAVALGLVLRARGEAMVPDPWVPLLVFGLASLGWAAAGLWRGRAREAGLFHAGLACCAFGLGGPQADAAGLMLLATAALATAALAQAARPGQGDQAGAGRALLLWVLALLPPFAPFGAGLAVVAAAADASLALAALIAGLATLGAAGLGRLALRAAQGTGGVTVPAAVVAGLALLAGMVPAVARWFDLMAGVVR